jgi:hypothetical protein
MHPRLTLTPPSPPPAGATSQAAADAILAEARSRGAAGHLTVLAVRLDWDPVPDRCERTSSSSWRSAGWASRASSASSSDSDSSGGVPGQSRGTSRAAFRWGAGRGAELALRPPLPSYDAAVG